MNIPLVSEYKIPFILHRIIQTFFGGLQLTTDTTITPTTNHLLIKLCVFLFPSSVGIVCSTLIEYRLVDSYIGVLIASVVGFLFTLIMQLICSSHYELYRIGSLVLNDVNGKKPSFVQKILPGIRYYSKTLMLLSCLLTSTLIGMTTYRFQLNNIRVFIHSSNVIAICIWLLVWFTMAIALHSLSLGPPPETATYSMAFNKINSMNRPVHLMIFAGIIEFFPSAYQSCTLIICCLPFLWLLGVVPPITALLHYFLEQVNILVFGGTCSASLYSLILTIVTTSLILVITHFSLSHNYFLLTASLSAYLISNKWHSNMIQMARWPNAVKVVLCLSSIIAIFYLPFRFHNQLMSTIVCLLCLVYTVRYTQQVYLVNKIKNPLSVLMSCKVLRNICTSRLTILVARICLHIGEWPIMFASHSSLTVSVFVVVLPLVCLAFIQSQLKDESTTAKTESNVIRLIHHILIFRMFRQVWQCPHQTAAIICILRLCSQWEYSRFIINWPVECQHLTIYVIISVAINFVRKLYLVLSILLSSILIKKQRLAYSWTLFGKWQLEFLLHYFGGIIEQEYHFTG